MSEHDPVTILVSYVPKAGKEEELLALIQSHYPTLRRLGLATEMPAQIYRAREKGNDNPYFAEIFQWADAKASDTAHQTPEVMAIWEPMGPLLETLRLTQLEPADEPSE